MRRLSYSADLFPSALRLEGVECPDGMPYGVGGYADVFRGTYEGNKVALKRLRVFQMLDEEMKAELRRVLYLFFCTLLMELTLSRHSIGNR